MADNIQTNVVDGDFVLVANADLRGKEGYLCKIVDATGLAKVALAAAESDSIAGVILEGGNTGECVTVRPLRGGRQIRVLSGATISGGAKVTSAADGKLAASGAAGAGKQCIGVTLEDSASGDYTLILPLSIANNA